MSRILHCWQDRGEWYAELYGFHSDEHIQAAYVDPGATCLLEAGHAGAHEWTPDSEISVCFARVEEVPW